MKKILLYLLVVIPEILFSQTTQSDISKISFGLHGGLSFISVKDGWGALNIEGRTLLDENVLLKVSFGYTNLTSDNQYEVRSYSHHKIENDEWYNLMTYEVQKTEYKIIPLSVGVQYNINAGKISPYIFGDVGINLIDPNTDKINYSYSFEKLSSYGEVPLDYRNIDILPNNSFKFGFGIGFIYPISSFFNIDIRYLTQIDTEIINSQQLLVGLIF